MRPWPMPSVIELPSDLSSPLGVIVEECRPLRVGDADLDVLVARLERHRYAAQRAARADRADEAIDLAAGLFPDFRTGAFDVGAAVGGVVELVGPDGAVRQLGIELLGQPAAELHVVVGVLVRLGRNLDELGAVEAQRIFLFLALGVGDDDDALVAQGVGDQRQADAGIPAVPSTMVPPARSRPFSTASRTMKSAARSFTDCPGLRNSALPRISQPVASETRLSGSGACCR